MENLASAVATSLLELVTARSLTMLLLFELFSAFAALIRSVMLELYSFTNPTFDFIAEFIEYEEEYAGDV